MVNEVGTAQGGDLSPEGRNLLERELTQGEGVVWACHPAAGVYARGSWVGVIFGVVFIGFSIMWFVMTGAGARLGSGAAPGIPVTTAFSVFSLCGFVPLAVGVALLVSPVWMRARAGRIVYAVTDRRAWW
ncbi:MAG: hypothetical protein QM783_19205 [Phycisphaerales bacterium]